MRHVFIIGSRGLPAKYGGFETFVEKLVENKVSSQIQYHVACLSDDEDFHHFDYKGVDCFTIKAPKLGPARVIAYDLMAINYSLKLVQEQQIKSPFFIFWVIRLEPLWHLLHIKFIKQAGLSLLIQMVWNGSGLSGLSQFKLILNILRRL